MVAILPFLFVLFLGGVVEAYSECKATVDEHKDFCEVETYFEPARMCKLDDYEG